MPVKKSNRRGSKKNVKGRSPSPAKSASKKPSGKKTAQKKKVKPAARPSQASSDMRKTKEELVRELQKLRQRNARLEKAHKKDIGSEVNLNAILDNTNEYILVCDSEGKPVVFNSAYAGIIKEALGVDMKPGLVPHKLIPDPEMNQWWDNLHRRVLGGEAFSVEYTHEFSASDIRHFKFTFTPIFKGRKVMGFTEISRDITKRKKAEERHSISEERYRSVVDGSPIGITVYDASGQCVAANESMGRIIGATREQVLAQNFHGIGSWKASGLYDKAVLAVRDKKTQNIDVTLKTSFGKDVSFSCYMVPFADDGLLFMMHDMTEQVRAQEAHRESEERFSHLVEHSPVAISIMNVDGTVEYVNERHHAITGYNRDNCPTLEMWWSLVYPDNEVRQQVMDGWNAFIASGKSGSDMGVQERQILCRDGTVRDIEISLMRIGRKVIVIFSDVTVRKAAEEKIRASLLEKEVLLREIHHRVKNNMAIISAFLSLQEGYADDDRTIAMFRESQRRIGAMALVHEELYQHEDFSTIDFRQYVLNLSEELIQAYGFSNEQIRVVTDIEDIALNLDTLIPCGLIMNELITNSLKYAFSEAKDPEIRITLKVQGDSVVLSIGDNGSGLPEDFDLQEMTGSLGLQIVQQLIAQLRGKVEIDRSGGAKYIISFALR